LARYDILIAAQNCTGCLRCVLACSELLTGRFSLAGGRIRVGLGDPPVITFLETCTRCGVCADNCLYEAIVKAEAREAS
jgi:Fe-S-cluster-containing dehydrogenase component